MAFFKKFKTPKGFRAKQMIPINSLGEFFIEFDELSNLDMFGKEKPATMEDMRRAIMPPMPPERKRRRRR